MDEQETVVVKVLMPADWRDAFAKKAKARGATIGVWLRYLAVKQLTRSQWTKLSKIRKPGERKKDDQ